MLLPLLLLLLAGRAVAEPACTLQLTAGPETFDHCFLAEGVGSNYNIAWTLIGTSPAQRVRWGLNSSVGGHAYVALGYPGVDDPDNAMIGGTAFLLQHCTSCPSGAELRQVKMLGTASGDMAASSALPMDDVVAGFSNGWLLGAFTTDLPAPSDEPELIYAAGEVYRSGDIRMHSTYGVMAVDLAAGTASDPESFSKPMSALLAAHIWLLLIGWGLLIPVGIVIARCAKNADPFWFQAHRALQLAGLLLGVIGFGLGFAVAGGWGGAFAVHRNLGVAATVLGLLQLSALVRPKLTSRLRRAWNLVHWWTGRAAATVAVANIYYGLANMVNTGTWGWGAYTAVFASIVAAAVLWESWRYLQLPPPGQATAKGNYRAGDLQMAAHPPAPSSGAMDGAELASNGGEHAHGR